LHERQTEVKPIFFQIVPVNTTPWLPTAWNRTAVGSIHTRG